MARAHAVLVLAMLTAACADGGSGEGGEGGEGGGVTSSGAAAEASAGIDAEGLAGGGAGVVEICDTISNSFRCARAVERRRLPAAERAARRGDTLRLVLVTGDTVRLGDRSGDHANVVHYSYEDHWRAAGYFVVHEQLYEGSQHVLVDDSTGERTVLADRPIPAPGGGRFAVLSLDLVAGYGPNVLQVWSLGDGKPTREWETEPTQWGPVDGAWRDSTTLDLTQHGYCDQLGGSGRSMCDRPATLRRVGGDWHLRAGRDVRPAGDA